MTDDRPDDPLRPDDPVRPDDPLDADRRLPAYLPDHLGGEAQPGPPDEVRVKVNLLGLERASQMLRATGARFVTLLHAGTPESALVAAFALRGDLVCLSAPTDGPGPIVYSSLGERWPAARWAEQELVERHGARPVGFSSERVLTRPDADLLDGRLEGADVFELPFGPVRSGVFEAIQFLIETGGENVPRIRTRPAFKHRGLEARCVGMDPLQAVHVAERVAGIAGVAHASAFSQAIERALGVTPPRQAERIRAVNAELERIACHLDVIAKQAETTALSVGHARFQILKEQVMRIRVALSGSRFGRGVVIPGGVTGGDGVNPDQLHHELDVLEREVEHDRKLFLETASMTDRLIGSGRLPRELVEDHGGVGPVARGSGLSIDARHERPYGEYRRLGLRVFTQNDGDAMARVNVRFGEIRESIRILRQALDHLARGNGERAIELPAGGSGAAFGWAEAPQGEVVTWVEVRDGLIAQVHIASPSFRNWALFDHAFPKDVLTDFAFIEHSFGLSVAGADR